MVRSKYIVKKLLLDFIIINLVINAVFYVVNFKDHKGVFTLQVITPDLLLGLIILGLACSFIGFINISKDLLKGEVELDDFKPNLLYRLFPKNTVLRVIILTLFTVLVYVPLFSLIPQMFGYQQISYWTGFAIKVVSAGIAAFGIGMVVLNLTMNDYRGLRS